MQSNPWLSYMQGINHIEDGDLNSAIEKFLKFIQHSNDKDDIAIAYINCGFLHAKIGKNTEAIKDFSNAIKIEDELESPCSRSKSLSYQARSESKYKLGDFKGSIDDLRKASQIKNIDDKREHMRLKYKLDDFEGLVSKYRIAKNFKFYALALISIVSKRKYDLIRDFKRVISDKKTKQVISSLVSFSEKKYTKGDYKAAIILLRRAWKYY